MGEKFIKDSLRPRPSVSTYFEKQIFPQKKPFVHNISIVLAFSSVVVVVVVVCFLCFEYCLKYSRDQKINDCLHATAIDIIVERSMIVDQQVSVKTPL